MSRWRDKHVVVTGASSGIGEALARELANAGAKLTLVARREDRLRALAREIGNAHVEVCDLADSTRATSWLAGAEAANGAVDMLVNNAGAGLVGPTDEIELDRGSRLLELNLDTPLRMSAALLPAMRARRSGTIVNVASVAGLVPAHGYFWYAAAKAGLAMASEALRIELAGSGVDVVTIYPGPVHSDMATDIEAQFEQTFWTRHATYGNSATLAVRVRRAVERGRARVIYPRIYALGRWCPPLAAWVSSLVAPAPLRKRLAP